MNYRFQYKILPQKKLIIEYYSGTLYREDLIFCKQSLFQNVAYNMTYNILHDFRDVTFEAGLPDVNTFIDFVKTSKVSYAQKKIALLTDHSNQVTMSYLFKMLKKETYLITEIFNTVEGAILWTGLSSAELDYVESILKELRQLANL